VQANAGRNAPDHGLFTSIILRGLESQADLDQDAKVSVPELAKFTLRELARASELNRFEVEQKPTYYFAGSSFFDLRAVGRTTEQ
jgi:hypothetical protein